MADHNLDPARWVDAHGDVLYRYALQKVGDAELARDLVQDALFAALKGASNYKGQAAERTWLVSILKNKIADHYRAKASGKGQAFLPADFSFFNEEGHWMENHVPGDWSDDAMAQMEQQEFLGIMDDCLEAMGGNHAEVIRLKFIEGEKSEAICNVLNITSSNYWVLVHRAKMRLRECLENNWFNSGQWE